MQEVRYRHSVNGGIVNGKERHGDTTLIFELAAFQRVLTERLRAYQENGAHLPFPKWFAAQVAAAVPIVDVTQKDWPEIKFIVAQLLEESPFRAWCHLCGQEYSQRQVCRQEWRDSGAVDYGDGRQFLCPHGHEIMFTLDCIS